MHFNVEGVDTRCAVPIPSTGHCNCATRTAGAFERMALFPASWALAPHMFHIPNVLPNRGVRTPSKVHIYHTTSSTLPLLYSANAQLDPPRQPFCFTGLLVNPRTKTRMEDTPRNAPPGLAEAPRAETYMSAAPPPLSGVTAWGGGQTPSQSSPPAAVETPPQSEHCRSLAK